jgi:sulfide:quinone oxidoreductase
MKLKRLNEDLSVADQITISDVEVIADWGFKSIICNRPDNETEGQVTYAQVKQEASKHGLSTEPLPVMSTVITEDEGESFGAAIRGLPKPVLAYCRTGLRPTLLWSLFAANNGMPVDEVRTKANEAIFDTQDIDALLRKFIPA